jgi:magnesium transporter
MPHPQNVRKRIKQLKDYINVTPDWICYGLLDDITDSFAPLIRAIEFEVDSIDELVLILKESEQSDMLRRIGYCRKRMMGLLRLLSSKTDVVKTLIKRGEMVPEEGTRPALSKEVALYLGDVQDHILSMLQSLNHYEKISSRSHSNYLAQISIEMTQTNNEINDVLSKLTALGSVLVPMNLVTGLWGMNVQVPGQYQEDLTWFIGIMTSILAFCIVSTLLMRYYNIV